MRPSFVSSTTQDGAALLRDSWCATRRTPTAWLAAAATPRSRLAPCMNAAVRPSRSEKMTRTVRSSRRVTPDEPGLIARTNVVLRARLAVLAHAAELELVGIGKRLRAGVGLGQDAVLLAVLGEAVLLHGRLRLGEILVMHVDQDVAEFVDPFAQLIV